MSEPTLALKKADYEAKTGDFLGYGRGPDYDEPAWTARRAADIKDCVESGIRQFYYPPVLEGETTSYDWSFLKPVAVLAVPADGQTVDLPSDFGGIEGKLFIFTSADLSSAGAPWPIPVTGMVRSSYFQYPTATGQPTMAEVEPVKNLAGGGQRYRLRLWPQPDQEYTVQFRYFINPNYLTGAQPYAYGGPQHAETILESCLSVAENRRDDARGIHYLRWMERLQASVALDRRMNPQLLGYNGDRSDELGYAMRASRHQFETRITFDGVLGE